MQWPCRDDIAEQNAEGVTMNPLLSHKKGEWTEVCNKFDGIKTFRRKRSLLNDIIQPY